MPFLFHIDASAEAIASGAPARLVISNSINQDILNHQSQAFSPEDIFVIHCSPQAVFKVRPATRCSSTLSGMSSVLWFYHPLPVLSYRRFVLPSTLSHQSRCHNELLTVGSSPPIGHTSPILCASFSPTGNLLATGSGDCNARLWDLFTETPSHVLSGHNGWVLCVEWEAMERKLATGGHDGHVSHQYYYCLAVSIEQTPYLISMSLLSSVTSWRFILPLVPLLTSPSQLLRFRPCRSSALQLRLWDPKTGKPIGEPLKGHSKWITSLAWEPIHLCVCISLSVSLSFRSPLAFAF